MTRIFLIAVFVGIIVGCSSGWKCQNRGNETHLRIQICDSDSWKDFGQRFESVEIVQFYAEGLNNLFSTIDGDLFRNMTNLVGLRLTACKVENISEDAFSRNLNLQELNLSENQIEEVPAKLFKNNRKLKSLWLGENKIKAIPLGLLDPLVELEEFSIIRNQIEVIHPSTFQHNKKLKMLWFGSEMY
jgi:hypothetical protein